jgi:hypothetical protein
MSKIALAGNASGTGTITLASPNTNTDFTINLPAASGTLVTTGGTVTFGAGSAAAPSITNTTNTNTGIYFPAVDTIGFSEGGVESFRLNSSGEGVFAGNVLAAGNLTVAGSAQVGGITTNLYPLVSGTAVNASGSSVEFTGIPSWVKRITVMFYDLSTTSTNAPRVQLGTASSYETSGYSAGATATSATPVWSGGANLDAFLLTGQVSGGTLLAGALVLTNITSNVWVATVGGNNPGGAAICGGGHKVLGGALTRLQVIPSLGTFDNGVVNIMYE